jgi:hypothetical protein
MVVESRGLQVVYLARDSIGSSRENFGKRLRFVNFDRIVLYKAIQHTTRVSKGFTFLAVLGVFPRSFPGVLNVSAKFLAGSQ